MASGWIPITDQLQAVGVATVDHRAHNPRRQHFPRRDQCLNLSQFNVLFFAAPSRIGRRSNRDYEPSAPLQPDQPAAGIDFRA